MPFGNVNVSYTPCRSVGQLKYAANYMLGRNPDQQKNGTVKTAPNLYMALGCSRDNFANNVLVTRLINGKSYSKIKPHTILAHKMSISFHPKDQVDYKTAYQIAKDFAERFAYSKGYEVLFAVHTDTDHVHAHFLISNCHMDTGKAYRRNQRDLYEMSEYFGEQCLAHGFTHSVRDNFYNHDPEKVRDKETFTETQMKKRGAETFKDELREVIQIELADPMNRTFEDVIHALKEHYNVECRVSGNTVSYRHPEYKDKNGNCVSVRGGRLGELYTRKGIEHELTKKLAAGQYQQPAAHIAAGLATAADGLSAFVAAGHDAPGGRSPGSRGQVSGVAAVGDSEQALQRFDEFYDRYRKRTEAYEQRAASDAERAGAVQKRNRRRGR